MDPRHRRAATRDGAAALDVRGRGQSWQAPPPFGLATIASDVALCLDHFDLGRAVVTGYSMGAWVTGLFGLAHAERVERLVLVDGGLPIPTDPTLGPEEAIQSVVGPALARLDMDFEDEQSYLEYWKGHPALSNYWHERMSPALVYELAETESGVRPRVNVEAIQVTGRDLSADHEANQAVMHVGVPTHLIVAERGTLDQPGGMIPLPDAEAAASNNPNISVEFVEDVNHYTLMLGKGAPTVASAIRTGYTRPG